jgi:hypothetical protein
MGMFFIFVDLVDEWLEVKDNMPLRLLLEEPH